MLQSIFMPIKIQFFILFYFHWKKFIYLKTGNFNELRIFIGTMEQIIEFPVRMSSHPVHTVQYYRNMLRTDLSLKKKFKYDYYFN